MEKITKGEMLHYAIAGQHNQKILDNAIATLNSFIQNGETIYLVHDDENFTILDKPIVDTVTLGIIERKGE